MLCTLMYVFHFLYCFSLVYHDVVMLEIILKAWTEPPSHRLTLKVDVWIIAAYLGVEYQDKHHRSVMRHGGRGIMICASFAAAGTRHLDVFESSSNSVQQNIYERNVRPSFWLLKLDPNQVINRTMTWNNDASRIFFIGVGRWGQWRCIGFYMYILFELRLRFVWTENMSQWGSK